ncbi:MAG: hypothetical protein ACK5PQ_05110 [Alphaproteobacteria bacterium]
MLPSHPRHGANDQRSDKSIHLVPAITPLPLSLLCHSRGPLLSFPRRRESSPYFFHYTHHHPSGIPPWTPASARVTVVAGGT